jgi:hypothetical protein
MGCRSSKAVAPAPLDSPDPETPQSEAEARALKTDVSRFTSAVFRDQATEALESILAAPPQIKIHFRAYLASERNESTLDFLDEVQRWHRLMGDEAADAAIHIYERYVRPGGEEELNLPSSLRRGNMFNDPEQHARLLERALHEVISLLALDAWPRFLRSKHCQAMLDQLMSSPETTWTTGGGAGQSNVTDLERGHIPPPRALVAGQTPDSANRAAPPFHGPVLTPADTTSITAPPASVATAAEAVHRLAPVVGGDPTACALPLNGALSNVPGSALMAAVSPSLGAPAVPSAVIAQHGTGGSSPGSRPYGSSLELSAALHAARSQLRMARGHWLQLFESVAEYIPSCIVIADVSLAALLPRVAILAMIVLLSGFGALLTVAQHSYLVMAAFPFFVADAAAWHASRVRKPSLLSRYRLFQGGVHWSKLQFFTG